MGTPCSVGMGQVWEPTGQDWWRGNHPAAWSSGFTSGFRLGLSGKALCLPYPGHRAWSSPSCSLLSGEGLVAGESATTENPGRLAEFVARSCTCPPKLQAAGLHPGPSAQSCCILARASCWVLWQMVHTALDRAKGEPGMLQAQHSPQLPPGVRLAENNETGWRARDRTWSRRRVGSGPLLRPSWPHHGPAVSSQHRGFGDLVLNTCLLGDRFGYYT